MFTITCKELTDAECDFEATGETKEEAKQNFYNHGAESPIHQKAYAEATEEQKKAFGEKVDAHLATQEGASGSGEGEAQTPPEEPTV